MPQLRSGRHFALAPPRTDAFRFGTDAEIYRLIVAYRLEVPSVKELCLICPVVYFDTTQGMPPDAPRYLSGYNLREVLEGKAGWSEAEIAEVRQWAETDLRLCDWLSTLFDEINQIIRDSPIWTSELVTDEPELGANH